MAFDAALRPRGAPSRIAVIGAGVSGLSAAWLLAKTHNVVVYEKDSRLGGHANTVLIPDGDRIIPVDAGFIVYNEPAYPNLTALFAHLGVETEETCMSFGASIDGGAVEYSGQTLSSVFADRGNLVSPKFWRMLADVAAFHRDARGALRAAISHEISLADFCREHRYSDAFRDYFLKPMAAAIWSTPTSRILDYSAAAFLKFYDNHGLLRVLNLPVWRTVTGGSRTYVNRIAQALRIRFAKVAAIRRTAQGVEVRDSKGAVDRFDDVIIAAHADQALAMLADADAEERSILGAFRYQPNHAVVHFDEAHMPKRRRAWSSWNHIGGDDRAAATYWMNRLQNLDCERNIFVTINPVTPVRDDLMVAEFDYAHPMFDVAAETAQRRIWSLQGRGGVWFCGAHFGQGFHEDGLQSGLAVAEAAGGVRRPWSVANESGRIHVAPPVRIAAE
jgi:predicted NAD/FAD-binding protein